MEHCITTNENGTLDTVKKYIQVGDLNITWHKAFMNMIGIIYLFRGADIKIKATNFKKSKFLKLKKI